MRHKSKGAPRGVVSLERRAPGGGAQPAAGGDLSDTQVMTMLEERRAEGSAAHPNEQAFSHIPLLRPEDTGTRLALKHAVGRGDPVSFVVQLRWSPQLIELNNTARDPIFRSYTVYTTRVRHDGREWFELRLGFFADAISAKQVAHYMQSEYVGAAVVPVSLEERAAARAAASAARDGVGKRPAADAPTAAVTPPAAAPAVAGRRPLFLIRRGGRRPV
jgi:hypothetical protein